MYTPYRTAQSAITLQPQEERVGVTTRAAGFADRERIVANSSQIWKGDDYVPLDIDEWLRIRDSEVAVADPNGTVIVFARTVNLTPG